MKASKPIDAGPDGAEGNGLLTDAFRREQPRLRAWLRRQVPDPHDIEDILQDAFYEFVVASRLIQPVHNAGAWLFTVIRNRVTDQHRRRAYRRAGAPGEHPGDDASSFEDLLPDPAAGPEEAYLRKRLIQALEDAVRALPDDQRTVFIAHEIDGVSFKAMADATGQSVNTLLSRKHYAVKSLRARLQEFNNYLKETS